MDTVVQRLAFGRSDAVASAAAPALAARVYTRVCAAFTCYQMHYRGLLEAYPKGVYKKDVWSNTDIVYWIGGVTVIMSLLAGVVVGICTDRPVYVFWGLSVAIMCLAVAAQWTMYLCCTTYWAALRAHTEWPASPPPCDAPDKQQRVTGLLDAPERQAYIDTEPLIFGKATHAQSPWTYAHSEANIERVIARLGTNKEFMGLPDEQQERVIALRMIHLSVYGK